MSLEVHRGFPVQYGNPMRISPLTPQLRVSGWIPTSRMQRARQRMTPWTLLMQPAVVALAFTTATPTRTVA